MRTFLIVTLPSYSKAYKELNICKLGDLKLAWDKGYDFMSVGGSYCSNRDVETMKQNGVDGVKIKHMVESRALMVEVRF